MKVSQFLIDLESPWDLGHFLDFEVQQAEAECERIGIRASFHKAA